MIQKLKGMYDITDQQSLQISYIKKLIQALMDKYNYTYVETPIMEQSSLFHRTVGETSDIVTKETYDFEDKGSRNVTLRPEGTAGVVRQYLENKVYGTDEIKKYWYYGPMFRYERPQSGRFRQFNQFGVELFGSSDSLADAEVISIVVNFFKLLGLKDIQVNLNTLGDQESRNRYRQALIKYFQPHKNQLCEDCQKRLEKNPLRILDCKIDTNKDFMINIPKITDYLNEESQQHFNKVQKYLKALKIDFVINPNIVRGLDYYTHTVFEVENKAEGFGSQNVLGAGGRYNNLVQNLGGPNTPGVGFAVGIERLLLALNQAKIPLCDSKSLDIYVTYNTDNEKAYALNITNKLRMNGFSSDIDLLNKKIKANFKIADKYNSKYIIIIGEEELNSNIITIKNNKTKEEFKIQINELIKFFDERIGE